MAESSAALLERLRLAHGKDIDLSLRGAYADLLDALGAPHENLPPTVVVAGTNGKGSTCAFLRAMIEAAGRTVHVYTSPHLIRFHERIRIAGKLIEEEELASILTEIEAKSPRGAISVFEAGTAAALAAFARHEADVAILEVGLGGRLDATNVLRKPQATLVTRLSYDHREYLGETMEEIAREKAGILRADVPCFTAPQPSAEAMLSLRAEATRTYAPLVVGGEDWRIEAVDEDHFRFIGPDRKIEAIPRPALVGTHQLWNAGLAMAALAALPFDVPDEAVRTAMRTVEWPGRLQRLTDGALADLLPEGWELWIDGGHNDSAGEVLGAQLRRWHGQDGKPLHMIYGMLSTKKPEEFLGPMLPLIASLQTLDVQGEVPGIPAGHLAAQARELGIGTARAAASLVEAVAEAAQGACGRILVCGSLYLAGRSLRENAGN